MTKSLNDDGARLPGRFPVGFALDLSYSTIHSLIALPSLHWHMSEHTLEILSSEASQLCIVIWVSDLQSRSPVSPLICQPEFARFIS